MSGASCEFGGLLLGKTDNQDGCFRTRVDGFELFPLERRYTGSLDGPYRLTPSEMRLLERRLSGR